MSLSAGSPVNTTVQKILWYNTGGLDYSDSLSLGFDACAIHFGDGALNNTILRSQYDNGSCLATFDGGCVEAVSRQSEEFAMQLVGSPTFLSDGNLTANSNVGVCDEITRRMATSLPQQCKPYYNETEYKPFGVALATDYNSTGFFFGSSGDPCMLKTSDGSNETFNGVIADQHAEVDARSHVQYDSNMNEIDPLVTVFMPIARSERSLTVTKASSIVTCLRITDYNPGSRIPARRSEPTPVRISAGGAALSNGELAGVIVAAILGAGLLFMMLVMWWLRWKKASRDVAESSLSDGPVYEKMSQAKVDATEIGNDGARHELGQRRPELPDVGSNSPAELEASNAGNRRTARLPL